MTIGDRALIGAGSTITQNVGEDDLVVARGDAKTLKGGAIKLREKYKSLKAYARRKLMQW